MIALGCDHIGIELKEKIIEYFKENNTEYIDCGCNTRERVNYFNYAQEVCKVIKQGGADKGILFCGSGVGMSIASNRIKGIRAVVCSEPYSAKISKMHNDTNVLCLGSRVLGPELAIMIIDEWLNARFEGGRHLIRVRMLDEIDFIKNE